jgi:hypothetical protein
MKPLATAIFTPVEHYCMALVLAAVAAGHRKINVPSGEKGTAFNRITAASRWLSRLGLELEMIVPRNVPSPYFRDYDVLPPETNDGLIELLKNGVGVMVVGRATAKIVKTYQRCEDAFRFIPRSDRDRDPERWRAGHQWWLR